ncbi:MAG: hypothetical protein ABSE16_02465 [Verrucomicrobiota bacterium]|jgi:hypothetical protein
MKKLAHLLILAVFSIACWFLWVILKLVPPTGHPMPGFTLLCIALRPVMIVLPVLAAAYCLAILFLKTERSPSWVVFFATTMSVLVLLSLPTMIAAYLPLVQVVHLTLR